MKYIFKFFFNFRCFMRQLMTVDKFRADTSRQFALSYTTSTGSNDSPPLLYQLLNQEATKFQEMSDRYFLQKYLVLLTIQREIPEVAGVQIIKLIWRFRYLLPYLTIILSLIMITEKYRNLFDIPPICFRIGYMCVNIRCLTCDPMSNNHLVFM